MDLKKLKNWLLLVLVITGTGCKNKLFQFPPALNEKPVALFVEEHVTESLQLRFSAADSFDPDGEILAYNWDFGDGTNGQGVETFHNYEEPGKYYVGLTVIDDDDACDTLLKEVDVYSRNELPTAVLSINAARENVDFTWHFDGSASYDPDGYIANYTFKIIRRSDEKLLSRFSGNQNLIVYIFKKSHLQEKREMSFEIKLTVTDNRDESTVAKKIIWVTDL